jgi:hypothetical protein
VDDATAAQALGRIRDHLDPEGAALVPLFVPAPVPDRHLGVAREHVDDRNRILRFRAISAERDDAARLQTTVLRYEVIDGADVQVVERPWVLHWHNQDGFGELAADAGLRVEAVLATDGSPAPPDATEFAFVVSPVGAPAIRARRSGP